MNLKNHDAEWHLVVTTSNRGADMPLPKIISLCSTIEKNLVRIVMGQRQNTQAPHTRSHMHTQDVSSDPRVVKWGRGWGEPKQSSTEALRKANIRSSERIRKSMIFLVLGRCACGGCASPIEYSRICTGALLVPLISHTLITHTLIA